MGEKVLCVPASAVGFTGPVCRADGPESYLKMLGRAKFLDRDLAEHDETYRQVIPYCMITHRGEVLIYRRGRRGTENRLHDKWSIGFGGHINDTDYSPDEAIAQAYNRAVTRELGEELVLHEELSHVGVVAILLSNETPVDRVHVGVVHWFVSPTRAVRSREPQISSLTWASPYMLQRVFKPKLERWSQLVATFCV